MFNPFLHAAFPLLFMAGFLGPHTSDEGNSIRLNDTYVEANGVRLHCVTRGKGTLILFLHGFPEFWYGWKNQLDEFGKDHLAVAPDLRGYNLSDKPAELDHYRGKVLIEDIRALADHFRGTDRIILVGHDWGGALAWAFAVAYPDYVKKLIIINAPHPGIFARLLATEPAQQEASQYMIMFRSPDAESILSANNYALLVENVLEPLVRAGAFTEVDKAAYLEAWSQAGALTGGLNYYRANHLGPPAPSQVAADMSRPANHFDVDPTRMVMKVPTLVIWGEKDTALITRNLDGLDELVSDLTVKRVPDGSHWVIHEKPSEVNRYIREFVQG